MATSVPVAGMSGHAVDDRADRAPRLIVAWQHPKSRLISPVGILDHEGGKFRFRYLQKALQTPDFRPFVGFSNLEYDYVADELFPFFQQRVMQARRPDYPRYITSLALPLDADPWEQLARSGGRRTGDTIQLFPEPRVFANRRTECVFLVHGIRHIERDYDPLVQRRIDKLEQGDELYLVPDSANPVNPRAVYVCSPDGHPLGWIPNLLLDYVHCVSREPGFKITVEHVNGEGSPYHFRLIARLEGSVPDNYDPFSGPDWEFISSVS